MLTLCRILLGAGLSAAGIIGAVWFMFTFRPGLAFVAFVCFVGCQIMSALMLPDNVIGP